MRYRLPSLLIFLLSIASCTKREKEINNTNTIIKWPDTAPYIITGLHGITLQNNAANMASLPLTIEYKSSVQERITLSVSGLPSGITIDTTWIDTGIPPFSTTLTIADTTDLGAAPGTYTIKLIATNDSGKVTTYPVTLKVLPIPTAFLGKYAECESTCDTGKYQDSLYADATVRNKFWFANYGGTGKKVYGLVIQSRIMVPAQVVDGINFGDAGPASTGLTSHGIYMSINVNNEACGVRWK